MKGSQFDDFIKNSLIDENNLTPEKALVETTKNLIKNKKKHDLWINKVYILCLCLICLIFSIKAISLSLQSENIIILNSLILSSVAIIILNFIYRHEIITFLKIKGE